MARSKFTQARLAHAVGMTQQALSRRLSAQTSFTVDELAAIASTLGVTLADIVGEAAA